MGEGENGRMGEWERGRMGEWERGRMGDEHNISFFPRTSSLGLLPDDVVPKARRRQH
ncbi:hypothetical protein IQ269_23510 [Tychonema sp. LEGE 07199]|nr:hypothetical protein [Tychonema sp. LEGE 07199]MBE9135091.1 hypothetical protein [Tychonema sp. LEGE 07196]